MFGGKGTEKNTAFTKAIFTTSTTLILLYLEKKELQVNKGLLSLHCKAVQHKSPYEDQ